MFEWLSTKLYGRRALAAVAITVFTFFVMLGPVTWLALSLAETVRMHTHFGSGVDGRGVDLAISLASGRILPVDCA
jgi:hypothetical protein